jgi:urea transporter
LEPSEYWEISAGLWGYNSLLTMGALTCVFYPLGPHSMVLGLVGAIATPIVQVVFRIWLVQKVIELFLYKYIFVVLFIKDLFIYLYHVLQCNVPYFTWPMSLVTLALMLAEGNGGLTRTQEMSIPEKQCVDHWGRQKVPQSDEDEKESV